jgi:Leucine-rich repeat (LRR) protein
MKIILTTIILFLSVFYGKAQSGFEKYFGKDVISEYKVSLLPLRIGDKELEIRLKETRFNNVTIHITEFDNLKEKVALINSYEHVTSIELASNRRDTAFTNIPKFRNLENIDFVYINGKMNLNYDSLWLELLKMPSLKFLGIYNIGKNMVSSPALDELLAKMEGIYMNQTEIYLPNPEEYPLKANSIVLESYNHETKNFFEPLKKASNLQFLSLVGFTLSDENVSDFRVFKELNKLSIIRLGTKEGMPLLQNIATLPKLKHFTLNLGKTTSNIEKNIGLLKNIEDLKVLVSWKSEACYIPESLFDLYNLKNLVISGFSDTILSRNIKKLSNLAKLELSGNFKVLPNEIGELKNLIALDISSIKITTLPNTIGKIKNLKSLEAHFCKLNRLPESIGDLEKLEYLNLGYNKIEELPKSIKKLTQLKELKLSNNNLKELPSEIGDLSSLELLELANNNLTAIPVSIGNLAKLKTLYLQNSNYMDLDDFKSDFSNNIQSLPFTISNMAGLESISCAHNKEFDGEILKELMHMPQKFERIDFSNCNITNLPKTGWSNLKTKRLDLSKNKIENFPFEIYQFDDFNELNLKNNEDKSLHFFLNNATELKVVGYLNGLYTLQEIKQSEGIVDALMSLSSRYDYHNNYNPILKLYPIALEIDSVRAIELLSPDKYADALYEAKRYEECIKPYSISIQRDIDFCVTIVNFIVPKIYNRANAYFYTGDNKNSLKDLKYLKKEFDIQLNEQMALTYHFMGEHAKADSIFQASASDFLEKIESKKNSEWWANELSLLELYIISNENIKFKNYYNALKNLTPPDKKSKYLLDYLYEIYSISTNQSSSNDNFSIFQKLIKDENVSFDQWSCQLADMWSKKLSADKAEEISKWNDLICSK